MAKTRDAELQWECKPCKFSVPIAGEYLTKVRQHLATKKHERLRNACPQCSSLRLKDIDGETWDRDGIREAKKCERCKTEFKSFVHGIVEKEPSEYTGEWPDHVARKVEMEFDRAARARGYIKRGEE
jgi:hypothetical protein